MWLLDVFALFHRDPPSKDELHAAQERRRLKAQRIDRISERIRSDASAADRRVSGR